VTERLVGVSRYAAPVRRVEKPWGYELQYALTERYCGKILVVRAGEQLSLQYHQVKDETVYLLDGRIEMEIDGSVETVEPGRAFHLGPGTVHRWKALEDSTVLEVSTPEIDDVVRLEDLYGRVSRG
jgi:mannose-6-phosphate isomerase